ncbi:hypothetical protein [Burkholderia ambifaria]|uniref:Uncharacterized protein n=1 Tax=Burkholderia ambifaria MEX-5 TaxID=396597 RepID=B1T0B1_9BURK|nr:hypothetical protein BamMEX5DRAFT_1227 [Burkholderia ambifaria MEX-5]
MYYGNLQIAETVSDGFGDFRFDGLAKGSGAYKVKIRHALGTAWRECELGESVYLGEIRLSRSKNAVAIECS